MEQWDPMVEEVRMQDDVIANPGTVGEYRGIKWETKRPYNTYLCGYIFPDDVSDKMREKLDMIAPGGMTGGTSDGGVGFDCAHAGDYSGIPSMLIDVYEETGFIDKMRASMVPGTYKDHDFVVAALKRMIDCVLK